MDMATYNELLMAHEALTEELAWYRSRPLVDYDEAEHVAKLEDDIKFIEEAITQHELASCCAPLQVAETE